MHNYRQSVSKILQNSILIKKYYLIKCFVKVADGFFLMCQQDYSKTFKYHQDIRTVLGII